MIWSAFLLGFLGSFHCIGMCGPIALTLANKDPSRYAWNKSLYHLGRSITYATLGLLIGFLGFSLALAGLQQGFSILLGIFLIIFSLTYRRFETMHPLPIFSKGNLWVKKTLAGFLQKGSKPAFFGTGLANGLLPCGMVYMALIASLGSSSPLGGALYMFVFGMGTVPILVVLMYSSKLFSQKIRLNFQRAIPVLGVIIGAMLILRGFGIGAMGFSPQIQQFSYGSEVIGITICQ